MGEFPAGLGLLLFVGEVAEALTGTAFVEMELERLLFFPICGMAFNSFGVMDFDMSWGLLDEREELEVGFGFGFGGVDSDA